MTCILSLCVLETSSGRFCIVDCVTRLVLGSHSSCQQREPNTILLSVSQSHEAR